ncbi:hypothetical protein H5T56_02205 [Candidatus Bipolaricaulota bacterium]|nr:hypothetical protein [Candidatus Bipolaricaulota bacterium]
MNLPKLPEALITPFQGFGILSGGALLAALLWPDFTIRRVLFLQILAFLQGVLAIQVGEAEQGYGPLPAVARFARLLFFDALSVLIVLPFLLVYLVETGTTWPSFLLSLLFLYAHGFVWMGAGHGLAGRIRSDGVRFVLKYGGLLLALFGPVVLAWPVSALIALPALWQGEGEGLWGLLLYLGLSGVSLVWWMRGGRSKGV